MISNLSYRWLGMPRELEFRLAPSERVNDELLAKRDDIRTRNGSKTINENRSDLGLPLLDSPEADMPLFVAGQSIFLLSPEGMVAAGTTMDEDGNVQEDSTAPASAKPESGTAEPQAKNPEQAQAEAPKEDAKKSAQDEIKSFIRWVRKGHTNRAFNFEKVEATYAEVLNKFVEAKDLDGARWYAERYLGL